MPLIGLTGLKQHGKDTAANFLVYEFGFKKFGFADPLRQAALDLNPLISIEDADQAVKELYKARVCVRYIDLLKKLGYEKAKSSVPEFRKFLQTLGTEAVRGNVSDDAWIQAMSKIIPIRTTNRNVICDCRFPNEAEWVRSRGELWRIKRLGLPENKDLHDSERFISSLIVDLEIEAEDGDIEGLRRKVLEAWHGREERYLKRSQERFYSKDQEATRYKERVRHIQKTYGLSQEDYEFRYKAVQEERCFLCGRKVPLCVDHDHQTGKTRGLLCRVCNAAVDVIIPEHLLLYRELFSLPQQPPVDMRYAWMSYTEILNKDTEESTKL